MNKDEVIALAEKCKLDVLIHSQWTAEIKEFTVVDYVVEGDLGSLMQFAKLVAQHEREACAEIAEKQRYAMNISLTSHPAQNGTAVGIANEIRARGQA